jgi:DNA-binding NtrC family response regulator
VLVVDDENTIRFAIRDYLDASGYEVAEAGSCAEAESAWRAFRPDVAVIDFQLPDGDALQLLSRIRPFDPDLPIVILTAHGSIDLAVRAIKEGADQFLTKPIELSALTVILGRMIENRRNHRKEAATRAREERNAPDPFLGESAAIRELAGQAARVLGSESPILLQGETGTGKGIFARWLHARGPRSQEPFVDLNSAGLSREFLESELFGHEKGAFTGAVTAKLGLFEVAHRGTMFLDEIGDVDLQVQPKLLKVLEERQFRRMGDIRDRHVDVRLIAATHHDLAELSRTGKFRSDLYFRVSAIPLNLPPLRERAQDIPVIARHLLSEMPGASQRGGVTISPEAEGVIKRYSWPGNIRELKNLLERALLFLDGKVLGRKDLRFDMGATPATADAESSLTLKDLERRHITRVLEEEKGNVEKSASRLGIPRSSLYEKIRRYGLVVSKV